MLRTGISVWHPEKKAATSRCSHRHVVGADTQFVNRAMRLHRTGKPEDSTRLSMIFPTRPNALMTHVYGQTLSTNASLKHVAA